jgi:hypothetical protein
MQKWEYIVQQFQSPSELSAGGSPAVLETPPWRAPGSRGRECSRPSWLEVTVEGDGYNLKRLIDQRQDIFAAYLQMKPEKREEQ